MTPIATPHEVAALTPKNSPVVSEPALPSDPHLRAIADDVLARLRYSFANAAAAAPGRGAQGSLDRAFASFVATQSPRAQAHHKQVAAALLSAPSAHGTFGRYASVSPRAYRTIGSDAIVNQVARLSVDRAALRPALEGIGSMLGMIPIAPLPPGHGGGGPDPDPDGGEPGGSKPGGSKPGGSTPGGIVVRPRHDEALGLEFKKLRLFVRKVVCVRETSGVLEGADEISMGGTATDAKAQTSIVSEFVVSTNFVDGNVPAISFSPGTVDVATSDVEFGDSKVFATWDLQTNPVGFPYVYSAVIALSEKDGGGFAQFLKDLYDKVRVMLEAAVSVAAGAAIGAALGSAFGPLGVVVGAIVGAFVDWLIGLFRNDDDYLGAKAVTIALNSTKKSYYDTAGLTSAVGAWQGLTFTTDGAYAVGMSFRVFPG